MAMTEMDERQRMRAGTSSPAQILRILSRRSRLLSEMREADFSDVEMDNAMLEMRKPSYRKMEVEMETTNTTIAKKTDVTLTEYGTREDILALARRIQTMMPGGDKLTLHQAMAAAQYSILVDANIFRGEIYAFSDRKGKLVLMDGYKILVRWAKRGCNYSEKWEHLTNPELPTDAIGYRCWILREDAQPLLRDMIKAGATWKEAFEIAATCAIGVVKKSERLIAPPKGWTWDQRARIRALKNALNLSHGAPSPREIAAESWMVGDTPTIPSDWAECTPEMGQEGAARLARLTADERARQAQPDDRTPDEILAANHNLLHGKQEEMLI